jgi:predicted membrane protein
MVSFFGRSNDQLTTRTGCSRSFIERYHAAVSDKHKTTYRLQIHGANKNRKVNQMKTRNVDRDKKVHAYSLSEPLCDATTVRVDVNVSDGNLMMDGLTGDEAMLASGTLEYTDKQGLPWRSVNMSNGQASLTLKAGSTGQPWFRLPWATCNGGTEWQIHVNPHVPADINAHSGGGNVKLDLSSVAVTHLSAGTGGGNMEVILPDKASNLEVTAETGAGNVSVEIGSGISGKNIVNVGSGAGKVIVHVPSGIAARIHASSGWGKGIVDSRFSQIDTNTYQSPDYDAADNKVEITAKSGAGDVIINSN